LIAELNVLVFAQLYLIARSLNSLITLKLSNMLLTVIKKVLNAQNS